MGKRVKVLLLTDVPPCTDFSGALLTLHLCRLLPPGSLACFCASNLDIDQFDKATDLEVPYCRVHKPREHGERLTSTRFADTRTFLRELRTGWRKIPRLARHVIAFGREQQVDRVWCILQGQTMIRLALPVARGLGVPLLTQIWDHPSWWLDAHRVDPLTSKRILRRYDRTLQQSTRIAGASFVMANAYQQAYGVPAVALIGSMAAERILPPLAASADPSRIRIGLAGQIYSRQEWNALLAALASRDWQLHGRPVSLRYLGREHEVQGSPVPSDRLELFGYRSQVETLRLMAECDVLYCPYFFDEDRRIISRTSFPSKLTTYLAAGRPVFFHGPHDAAPAVFLREHTAGHLCHSLEPASIAESLNELLASPQRCHELAGNGYAAVKQHLTYDALAHSFGTFLGQPLISSRSVTS
jgi:hypothetical protein